METFPLRASADLANKYRSNGWWLVERFAGALYDLGVRPGEIVTMQLPNGWQACALYLAVTRLRAVVAPVMTTIRRRELERLLERVGANVFGSRPMGRSRPCRSGAVDRPKSA